MGHECCCCVLQLKKYIYNFCIDIVTAPLFFSLNTCRPCNVGLLSNIEARYTVYCSLYICTWLQAWMLCSLLCKYQAESDSLIIQLKYINLTIFCISQLIVLAINPFSTAISRSIHLIITLLKFQAFEQFLLPLCMYHMYRHIPVKYLYLSNRCNFWTINI